MSKSQTPTTTLGRNLTPVGVDVGVAPVATVAAASDDPSAATVVDAPIREPFEHLVAGMAALDETHPDGSGRAALFAAFGRQIRAHLDDVATGVVEVASSYPAPILVLEDLPTTAPRLWALRDGDTDQFETWVLARVQRRIATWAVSAGVPVVRVDPDYTTRECHECQRFATLAGATIVCNHADCPVDEVDRDASAALSIARRFK